MKPILQNAVKTLRQFLSRLEVERLSQTPSSSDSFEVSGTLTHIGITGHLSGSIQYKMKKTTVLNIASGMYREPIETLDEEAKAAIREFVNIATGNAITDIQSQYNGKKLDITPPSLMIGDNIILTSNLSSPPLRIPLRTNYGDFRIDCTLEESDE